MTDTYMYAFLSKTVGHQIHLGCYFLFIANKLVDMVVTFLDFANKLGDTGVSQEAITHIFSLVPPWLASPTFPPSINSPCSYIYKYKGNTKTNTKIKTKHFIHYNAS